MEQRQDHEDHELVRATLEGDREAFDELVGRYQSRIFNLALRITGSSEDALDAAQTTFLKVYENLERFDPTYRFFSWIYRIGVNTSLHLVDRGARFSELDTEPREPAASPEEVCSGRETGREIQAALHELTPDQRAVVVLRHFHDLSYDQMSQVLEIPAKTVKSRLFSARRELRSQLAGIGLTRSR